MIKAVALASHASIPVKWHVSALLDVPGGLDIAKKVQISVGE